eukprot:760357-Hanusia_phi.AAC.2
MHQYMLHASVLATASNPWNGCLAARKACNQSTTIPAVHATKLRYIPRGKWVHGRLFIRMQVEKTVEIKPLQQRDAWNDRNRVHVFIHMIDLYRSQEKGTGMNRRNPATRRYEAEA